MENCPCSTQQFLSLSLVTFLWLLILLLSVAFRKDNKMKSVYTKAVQMLRTNNSSPLCYALPIVSFQRTWLSMQKQNAGLDRSLVWSSKLLMFFHSCPALPPHGSKQISYSVNNPVLAWRFLLSRTYFHLTSCLNRVRQRSLDKEVQKDTCSYKKIP